jgi:hypothetical protein
MREGGGEVRILAPLPPELVAFLQAVEARRPTSAAATTPLSDAIDAEAAR